MGPKIYNIRGPKDEMEDKKFKINNGPRKSIFKYNFSGLMIT